MADFMFLWLDRDHIMHSQGVSNISGCVAVPEGFIEERLHLLRNLHGRRNRGQN